jgi:pyruvate kinase
MSRHTKIVATLGPASSDLLTLERLVHAGVDVVRLNFSHGKAEDHIARATQIREAASWWGARSASWPTCRGPRSASASSRRARSPDQGRRLHPRRRPANSGNVQRVGLDYKDLPGT